MISIIIPAFNEAGNIHIISLKLQEQLSNEEDYEIIFVDDGSTDQTLREIKNTLKINKHVKYISFSRNFGHQKALKAGLDYAKGDCVITMDADMQHPPELIGKLIAKWREGYSVVYTIRKNSSAISFTKRVTSTLFYKLINIFSDLNIPVGAADFRLLDRNVVDELQRFNESHLFIRGLVSWIGFKQTGIEYTIQPRYCEKSKYSLLKMFSFALQGITSFSIFPLRIATFFGFFISVIATFYMAYALYVRFFTDSTIKGWTSILISILFLGGIQLISLGLIGEYLGKMFIEAKRRPNYIIKEILL